MSEHGSVQRLRVVASEIKKTEFRQGNHQGAPPLVRLRATLSCPASCRRRTIRVLRIRKDWTQVVGSASDRIATSSFCPETSIETSRAMRVDFLG